MRTLMTILVHVYVFFFSCKMTERPTGGVPSVQRLTGAEQL